MEEALSIPESLPFLEALGWYDARPLELSPRQMLMRYEDGWRFRGVLADPSPEELEFIRRLVLRYGSTIAP